MHFLAHTKLALHMSRFDYKLHLLVFLTDTTTGIESFSINVAHIQAHIQRKTIQNKL